MTISVNHRSRRRTGMGHAIMGHGYCYDPNDPTANEAFTTYVTPCTLLAWIDRCGIMKH